MSKLWIFFAPFCKRFNSSILFDSRHFFYMFLWQVQDYSFSNLQGLFLILSDCFLPFFPRHFAPIFFKHMVRTVFPKRNTFKIINVIIKCIFCLCDEQHALQVFRQSCQSIFAYVMQTAVLSICHVSKNMP